MEILNIFEDLKTQGLKQEHEFAENLLFILQSYLKSKLFIKNEQVPIGYVNNTHDFAIAQLIEEEGEITNNKVQNVGTEEQEEALDIVNKKEENRTVHNDSPDKNCKTEVRKNETSKLDTTKPTIVDASRKQVEAKVASIDAFIKSVKKLSQTFLR